MAILLPGKLCTDRPRTIFIDGTKVSASTSSFDADGLFFFRPLVAGALAAVAGGALASGLAALAVGSCWGALPRFLGFAGESEISTASFWGALPRFFNFPGESDGGEDA